MCVANKQATGQRIITSCSCQQPFAWSTKTSGKFYLKNFILLEAESKQDRPTDRQTVRWATLSIGGGSSLVTWHSRATARSIMNRDKRKNRHDVWLVNRSWNLFSRGRSSCFLLFISISCHFSAYGLKESKLYICVFEEIFIFMNNLLFEVQKL